jgi:hypothetical protein
MKRFEQDERDELTPEESAELEAVQALAREPEWIQQLRGQGYEDQTHHAAVLGAVSMVVAGLYQLHILEVGLSEHCTQLISLLTVDTAEEESEPTGDTAISVEEEWGQVFQIMREGLQSENHTFVNCRHTDDEGHQLLDTMDMFDIVSLNGDPLTRRVWLQAALNQGVQAVVLNFADRHLECGYAGIVVPKHYYISLYVHKSGDKIAVFHKDSRFQENVLSYTLTVSCAGTTWLGKGSST